MRKTTLALAACCYALTVAATPEPVSGCQDAIDSFESDPAQALEDALWCVERLKQVQQDAKANQFIDEFNGWQGDQLSKEMVMGMSTIKRDYIFLEFLKVAHEAIMLDMFPTFDESSQLVQFATVKFQAEVDREQKAAAAKQ